MACGLKAAHRLLALAGGLVRIFRTVVQPFVAPMFDTGQHLISGDLVAAQFVGDEHAGDIRASREELPEELLGRSRVAPPLDQQVEPVPLLVHGAPEVVRFAADRDEYLVAAPCIAWPGTAPTEIIRVSRARVPVRYMCVVRLGPSTP